MLCHSSKSRRHLLLCMMTGDYGVLGCPPRGPCWASCWQTWDHGADCTIHGRDASNQAHNGHTAIKFEKDCRPFSPLGLWWLQMTVIIVTPALLWTEVPLWLQVTHRALNSAFRTDGSRQHKPGDTAGVRASRTLQAPDIVWMQRKYPRFCSLQYQTSKSHLPPSLLKIHRERQQEEVRAGWDGGGVGCEAGQARGWRPEAAWPPRPPGLTQPVSLLLWGPIS